MRKEKWDCRVTPFLDALKRSRAARAFARSWGQEKRLKSRDSIWPLKQDFPAGGEGPGMIGNRLRKIVFRLQRFELRMVQVHRIAQQRPIALPVQGLWTVPRPSDGERSISRLFVYPDRHEPA